MDGMSRRATIESSRTIQEIRDLIEKNEALRILNDQERVLIGTETEQFQYVVKNNWLIDLAYLKYVGRVTGVPGENTRVERKHLFCHTPYENKTHSYIMKSEYERHNFYGYRFWRKK